MRLSAAIATILSVSLPGVSAASIVGAGEGHCETSISQDYECSGDDCIKRFFVRDANWVQLDLKGTKLVDGAILRLTSKHDVTEEITAANVKKGSGISSQLAGNFVDLELLEPSGGVLRATSVDLGLSTVKVNSIITDAPCDEDAGVNSICGPTDDRILFQDPRNGRIGGCTGWLISEDIFVLAGHCELSPSSRIHFTHDDQPAPPADQYAVVPGSHSGVNGGVGNDWAVGRLEPNDQTGLKAGTAQGSWYELGDVPDSTDGIDIRITGYGVASVLSRWQKTHEGALVTIGARHLQYIPDTTGGNSGSPVVINDPEHEYGGSIAIGIHTHGGCSSSGGGSNKGTRIDHPDLQEAIAALMGGTSSPTPAPVPCTAAKVEVKVFTDDYPHETSWTVEEIDGSSVPVMSKENYDKAGELFEEEGCLPAGDYRFTIKDSYGDGICCAYGHGYFLVKVEGVTVVEGGAFEDEDVHTFEIEDPATPHPSPAPTAEDTTQFPTYFTCRQFNEDDCAGAYGGNSCQWVGDCHNCGCVPMYRES